MTVPQREAVLSLNRQLRCGIVVAYWSMRFWGYDTEAALILLEELGWPTSTFDYPDWCKPR